MKVAIIGATGPTGCELVRQGLEARHELTAAVRRPESANLPVGVRVLQADVSHADSLASVVADQEVVVCLLGSKLSRKPTTLLSSGTRNLIDAMKSKNVLRLICVTGIGAGDSKGHGGFLYDWVIQPLLLNEIYKDKDRQEELVRRSELDWTLVRPATLTNGPRTDRYRVLTDLSGVTAKSVSRADVAAYILNHLVDTNSVRSTVLLTY